MLDRARAALLELLLPSRCPSCDAARREGERTLCTPCWAGLHPLAELAGVATALAYESTAERLVLRFKFERRMDALRVLLEPLVARAAGLPWGAIVPVPRHPARIREQGFDPVYTLARALASRSGRPLRARVLRRSRRTPPQTGLSPAQRQLNVLQSFAARPGSLRSRTVILLDDVTTTGATLREAAAVLRNQAQARRVVCAALAGTTLPFPDSPAL